MTLETWVQQLHNEHFFDTFLRDMLMRDDFDYDILLGVALEEAIRNDQELSDPNTDVSSVFVYIYENYY